MKHFVFFRKPPLGNDSGFTLLEAIIALFVFSIGILATMSMQTSSLHGNLLARETTEASSVAASVIENLRPLSYADDPMLATGTNTMPNHENYAITYTIQRDTILDNTMLIQVTVNWTERGRPKTVNLTYMKSDII